jgi:hypothetical protein
MINSIYCVGFVRLNGNLNNDSSIFNKIKKYKDPNCEIEKNEIYTKIERNEKVRINLINPFINDILCDNLNENNKKENGLLSNGYYDMVFLEMNDTDLTGKNFNYFIKNVLKFEIRKLVIVLHREDNRIEIGDSLVPGTEDEKKKYKVENVYNFFFSLNESDYENYIFDEDCVYHMITDQLGVSSDN